MAPRLRVAVAAACSRARWRASSPHSRSYGRPPRAAAPRGRRTRAPRRCSPARAWCGSALVVGTWCRDQLLGCEASVGLMSSRSALVAWPSSKARSRATNLWSRMSVRSLKLSCSSRRRCCRAFCCTSSDCCCNRWRSSPCMDCCRARASSGASPPRFMTEVHARGAWGRPGAATRSSVQVRSGVLDAEPDAPAIGRPTARPSVRGTRAPSSPLSRRSSPPPPRAARRWPAHRCAASGRYSRRARRRRDGARAGPTTR